MATTLLGPSDWSMEQDDELHRTYTVVYKVASATTDGPAAVLATSGLPAIGDTWSLYGDADAYAYRQFKVSIRRDPTYKDDKGRQWLVTMTFSTKFPDLCSIVGRTFPLDEPAEISISSIKKTREMRFNKYKLPIVNSAHEPIKGHPVEFDIGPAQVKIKQNVPIANLALLESMKHSLNDDELWGMMIGCVKLTDFQLTKKYYALCEVYWERELTFEVNKEGFFHRALDEGNKVLHGEWSRTSDTWLVTQIGGLRRPIGPVLVPVPGGGTLAAGTYTYSITALDSNGETLPSPAASVTVTANSSIALSWGEIAGASSYKIYGRSGAPASLLYIDETPNIAYIDNGSLTPAGTIPTGDTTGITPDPDNPQHFQRFYDRNGNVTRAVLNGAGLPAGLPVGEGATAAVNQMELDGGIEIKTAGSGYSAGQVLSVDGGARPGGPAQFNIVAVDGDGAITDIVLLTNAVYTELPDNPVSFTGGLGTGFTAIITWRLVNFTVTAGGTGYSSAPTVSFDNGGAEIEATATAVVAGGAVTSITLNTAGEGYVRIPDVILSSIGLPDEIIIEYYPEADFTELDIPLDLEAP